MDEKQARYRTKELIDTLNVPTAECLDALEKFEQELIRWQKVKNLVSRETLSEIWSRHILDSVQLFTLFPHKNGALLDLGSGGGLPAIPLAIIGQHTGLKVHMVEANGRKCSFLKQFARQVGLKVEVHNVRAEALQLDEQIDYFTARGFAALDATFAFIDPHFEQNSSAFLQKGRGYDEEIAAANQKWRYDYSISESLVASDSVILGVRNLQKRQD